MPFSVLVMISISFIVFVISFLLSLSSNLLIDALIRSLIVFVITAASLFAIRWFFHLISNQESQQDQRQAGQSEPENHKQTNEATDSNKGGFIDLKTPVDDNEAFVPFEPKRLNDQDD